MAQPTILISGAGIAGPALAFWLNKTGYRVTIVELADGIRPGGQTVDLRGAGGDVVGRMGLLAEMHARSLDQRGAAWIRADGSRRADMPVTAFNGNGLVSKLEILRGDLVDVLYQATNDHTEYRFNTRIEDVSQNAEAVQATLSDGTTVSADLVVGCDGPHSAVRRLVFGAEEQFVKPLGGYNAWFTAPDTVGLDGWYLMYQAPGLNASMRPSHDPAMCKAGLAFRSEPVAYDRRNTDEQRALLAKHFAGAGWQCDALLSAAAEADDFYFDAFAQVHMPTISRGRVTLAGDAGYCASPLSGMGTSLALVGAYVLAGELGSADSLDRSTYPGCAAALRGCDATVHRPVSGPAQRHRRVPAEVLQRHCHHRAGDEVDAALAISLLRREKWFTIADAIDLPDY